VDKGSFVIAATDLGQVSVSRSAIAQIVGEAVAESYGVVGRGGRRGPLRLLVRDRVTTGIEVAPRDGSLALDVHVVIEHGLNLAEVAARVRSRVVYEVERQTGLSVGSVEVHVDDVRRSG
jgi:uncharacterized alkaline shock family protein YloU